MSVQKIIFVLLIFSINTISSQTLEETIKYIESKYPIYITSEVKETIKIDEYGNIKFISIIEDQTENSIMSFNINDVIITHKIVKYDPDYFGPMYILHINCNNTKPSCINATNFWFLSKINCEGTSRNFRGKIELEKILKALNHLKKVTKKEPF